MDWGKVILSGLKVGVITLVGIIATVLAAALTLALGYKPEGALPQVVMTYVVTPLLAGIIAMLNNYLKHKDDK